MGDGTLRTVLDALPKLTRKQLAEVSGRLSLLGSDDSNVAAEVHRVMVDVLGGGVMPFHSLAKSPRYGRFFRGALALDQFIADVFGRRIGKLQRVRVLMLLVRCVVNDLKEKNLPVGPTTIGDGLCRLPEIVEDRFPGYLAAGILRKALLEEDGLWHP